jgi:hypothetical protein
MPFNTPLQRVRSGKPPSRPTNRGSLRTTSTLASTFQQDTAAWRDPLYSFGMRMRLIMSEPETA